MYMHILRLCAGIGRWVLMPLVFSHALSNYLLGRSHELVPGAKALGMDMPLIDGPKLLRRCVPFSSYLLPQQGLEISFPSPRLRLLSQEHSAAPPSLALTLEVSLHPHELFPEFLFLAGVVAGLRLVQVALWLLAAPSLRKDSKLRVLIVGDSIPPKVDGVAVRVGHLVPALLANGHSVHIVNSIRSEPLGAAGVTQLMGYESELYRGHSITLPNPLGVLGAILRFKPHVIHIMDESFLQASAQVAANVCLIPTVWSHHSRLDKFAQACAFSHVCSFERRCFCASVFFLSLPHALLLCLTPKSPLPAASFFPLAFLCRPPIPVLPPLLPAALYAADTSAHLCVRCRRAPLRGGRHCSSAGAGGVRPRYFKLGLRCGLLCV